ncbi:MAG TPA: hypothetical protein VNO22_09235 [Planctomycetota bacterium]|nr:hypothetical protein [Planctomycetota bacterium]
MRRLAVPLLAALGTAACAPPPAEPERAPRPFVLHVVDEETGRGVPLVELRTTNEIVFHTDNAGVIAFDEPGLLGERVFFYVESPGYEFPADGFGYRGTAIDTAPGGRAVLKVRRVQIAERLYRITGQGLYHHSARAGLPVPLRRPQLNARVMGQDSTLAVVHRGRIRWFWGDTNRPGYPLGHFGTATAVSRLPEDGGLPPSVGIDLEYAADESGFSRPTFASREPTPIWIEGVFVLPDPGGRERLLACYKRMKNLETCVEQGIAVFEDEEERFRPLVSLPLDEDRLPTGQPFRVREGGTDFVYFATPYPTLRVRARWEDVLDPSRYEAFTPLREGARYDPSRPDLERDASGKPVYAWKRGTSPVDRDRQDALARAGALPAEEGRWRTADAASGEPLRLHRGSVRWNPFRGRWVMIANRIGAPGSMLGDVYYAEAARPEGPWSRAARVAVHGRHSFYNPVHHDFFDEAGGRRIYFEGTYTRTFSDAPAATPRYEYNQILYRLDLSDPRLAPARED